jgi:hypothetical protein
MDRERARHKERERERDRQRKRVRHKYRERELILKITGNAVMHNLSLINFKQKVKIQRKAALKILFYFFKLV